MTSGYNGPPRADKVRPEPPPAPPRLSTGPPFAWLIEYGPSTKSYPLYFAGFGPAPAGAESVICGNLCGSWSYANDCAIRFARKEDAEKLLAILQVGGPHRVVEHGWG